MPTYKIIGADLKEYGPVSSDELRAWIAEGRANAATRVRAEEGGNWQRLADIPEFSQNFRASAPPLPSSQGTDRPRTSGMAIASLVLGIMGVFTCGLSGLAGLIFGPLAMNGIRRSNGRLTGHGIALAGTIVSGFSLLLIPFLAAMLLPAFAKAKTRAQTIMCVNNLKQLGLAARIYSTDHTNQFPPALTWCDAIKPEIPHEKVFQCPSAHNAERCHYAFNAKLDGLDIERVAPDTVLFFESEGGWNRSGGPELIASSARHGNVFVVGFVDGSVQSMSLERLRALRWEPRNDL